MKKIIVAPLNWGLGHASRCVPIIRSLIENGYTPVISTDGAALLFLQKEFPALETIQLPAYHISYAKNIKRHLLFQTPKILRTIVAERRVIEKFVSNNDDVIGVISDNRFGVRSTKVPSVYMTHQINVLSGWMTFLTSYVHRRIIRNFDECWIPDEEGSSLSGQLSRSKRNLHQKYIGPLSRFSKEQQQLEYDLAIVLSGPEPHRGQLEKKIRTILELYKGNIVLVRGVIEPEQKKSCIENITIYNYVLSKELQEILNTSEVVVSRSGYSSVMDYVATEKKAVLIPTRGQTEQEYLGEYLAEKGNVISVNENEFSIQHIEKAKDLKGLRKKERLFNSKLFGLFERK